MVGDKTCTQNFSLNTRRDHLRDLGVDERIVLKCTLKTRV